MSRGGSKHFGDNSRVSEFVRDEERALRVAKALVDSGAYHVDSSMDSEQYFTWKSGIRAPCYCNCRALSSRAVHRRMVATELSGAIRERFSHVDAVVVLSRGVRAR
jgi:orotate phosphoribosyltransferase